MSAIQKPTLTIGEEKFEMIKFKSKQWREFFKFDSERGELPLQDLIDKHCEIIAMFFPVSVEKLLEEIELADVLKIYHEIRIYLVQTVTSKLAGDEKNAETGDSQN